jgi:dipeptidyl aminopeptidase/acylaminoacyl peptidase
MQSIFVCAVLIFSSSVWAETVMVKGGNIFLNLDNGKLQQLTHNGYDSEPVVSTDGKWVAFVRDIPGKRNELSPVETNDFANELWVVATDGSKEMRLVSYGTVSGKSGAISAIHHPQFFPDNRHIAFAAAWAVVEGSVHIVDLQTKKLQFVSAGNSVEVVPNGEYQNHLIVSRHKYFLPGGTYDWYWLLDTDGKEIGAIGEEENLKLFREMYQ